MELALIIVSIVTSLVSLGLSLRRKHVDRMDQLRQIGEESVDVALNNASSGIPVRRTALEVAILHDLRDGKQDFTREQLWASVEAACSRRGIK